MIYILLAIIVVLLAAILFSRKEIKELRKDFDKTPQSLFEQFIKFFN